MIVLERFTDTPPITREDLRVAPVTFDLYREIHKGIRAELFGVTGQAGSLDPADEAGRVALFGRVRALADLLESHAHHEDTIMQPSVEEYVPAVAEQVIADHEVLDRRVYGLVALGEAVADASAATRRHELHELYLGLAAFTGSYLQHIDVEERVIMPALSDALEMPGLLAMHNAIISSIPPDEMARSLALMLPAMNLEDRVEMLAGMRAGAPVEVFAGVVAIAEASLAPADMEALAIRLASPTA